MNDHYVVERIDSKTGQTIGAYCIIRGELIAVHRKYEEIAAQRRARIVAEGRKPTECLTLTASPVRVHDA